MLNKAKCRSVSFSLRRMRWILRCTLLLLILFCYDHIDAQHWSELEDGEGFYERGNAGDQYDPSLMDFAWINALDDEMVDILGKELYAHLSSEEKKMVDEEMELQAQAGVIDGEGEEEGGRHKRNIFRAGAALLRTIMRMTSRFARTTGRVTRRIFRSAIRGTRGLSSNLLNHARRLVGVPYQRLPAITLTRTARVSSQITLRRLLPSMATLLKVGKIGLIYGGFTGLEYGVEAIIKAGQENRLADLSDEQITDIITSNVIAQLIEKSQEAEKAELEEERENIAKRDRAMGKLDAMLEAEQNLAILRKDEGKINEIKIVRQGWTDQLEKAKEEDRLRKEARDKELARDVEEATRDLEARAGKMDETRQKSDNPQEEKGEKERKTSSTDPEVAELEKQAAALDKRKKLLKWRDDLRQEAAKIAKEENEEKWRELDAKKEVMAMDSRRRAKERELAEKEEEEKDRLIEEQNKRWREKKEWEAKRQLELAGGATPNYSDDEQASTTQKSSMECEGFGCQRDAPAKLDDETDELSISKEILIFSGMIVGLIVLLIAVVVCGLKLYRSYMVIQY